jgi:hypothetical protein
MGTSGPIKGVNTEISPKSAFGVLFSLQNEPGNGNLRLEKGFGSLAQIVTSKGLSHKLEKEKNSVEPTSSSCSSSKSIME